MSKAKPQTIDVEIYDQRYTIVLKKPIDETEVRAVAEHVDTRMREIAAVANTADSLRVAVLTALHLALEYKELKTRCDQNDAMIESKANAWSQALEDALKAL